MHIDRSTQCRLAPRQVFDRDGGRPLDPAIRQFMESRFSTSFRHVRIHSGPAARAAAQTLDARAFTFGSHIFFAADEYSHEKSSRERLLAHELAHVAKQGNLRFGSTLR